MRKSYLCFYFAFDGRATRYDFLIRYWLPVGIGAIIVQVLHVDMIALLWKILAFLAGLAVNCRRLHDLNLSGWWQVFIYILSGGAGFWALVVFFLTNSFGNALGAFLVFLCSSSIYFIYLSIKRGTVGPNKYGPDMLYIEEYEA